MGASRNFSECTARESEGVAATHGSWRRSTTSEEVRNQYSVPEKETRSYASDSLLPTDGLIRRTRKEEELKKRFRVDGNTEREQSDVPRAR